jgi:small subunit ribosomal protein S21
MNRHKKWDKRQEQEQEFEWGNAVVYLDYDENIERAIRRFKKLLKKSGVLEELQKRQAYEKPSDRKRRKKQEQRRKHLKEQKQKNKETD